MIQIHFVVVGWLTCSQCSVLRSLRIMVRTVAFIRNGFCLNVIPKDTLLQVVVYFLMVTQSFAKPVLRYDSDQSEPSRHARMQRDVTMLNIPLDKRIECGTNRVWVCDSRTEFCEEEANVCRLCQDEMCNPEKYRVHGEEAKVDCKYYCPGMYC